MRITESRLRRIIRSVILESVESQNKIKLAENYASEIYFDSVTSKLEIFYKENPYIKTKEECFNWALYGIRRLKRQGEIKESAKEECLDNQINLELDSVNLKIKDIAGRIALWIVDGKNRMMSIPKLYTQEMENQYKIGSASYDDHDYSA